VFLGFQSEGGAFQLVVDLLGTRECRLHVVVDIFAGVAAVGAALHYC
jgi:hypothetical protein